MKLVIFDMDGLMFDSEIVMVRAFLEVAREWGLPASREQALSLIGKDSRAIWELYKSYFGEDLDAQALYRSVGLRIQEIVTQEGIAMKPGLLKLLDQLDVAGIQKVIASGSSRSSIMKNLKKHGIEHRFDGIISSEEVKKGKPAPDVFLACLDLMKMNPQDALVLEDSPMGIMAALAAKIPVIAVPDQLEIPLELQGQCVAVKETLGHIEIE